MILLLIFLVLIVVIFIAATSGPDQAQLLANAEKYRAAETERDAFLASINGFSLRSECRIGNKLAWLMLNSDAGLLRAVTYTFGDGSSFSVTSDTSIPLTSIFEATVTRENRVEWYTREEVVPGKRKSPVGRGLVGAALLGPVGAVLGAASGLNQSTKTVDVSESRVVQGPPTLILGIRDPQSPLLKVSFLLRESDAAEQWLFRIKAAMS